MKEMSHMSIPCVTKIYTQEDADKNEALSGLLFYDNGAWYAQPLCAEFVKVCEFEVPLEPSDIYTINNLKTST